jgi:hypothetical protein
MSYRSEIEWSPRVSLVKIRALYVNEARGTCDDELIEEVGSGLLARCQSILEYTEACEAGKVRCKPCAKQGQTTIIQRNISKSSPLLRCPGRRLNLGLQERRYQDFERHSLRHKRFYSPLRSQLPVQVFPSAR